MNQRTLVLVKPDGVKRNLIGEIISRYERAGLRVVALKFVQPHRELAESHYTATHEQVVGMGNKTLSAAKEAGNMEKMMKIFGTDDPEKIGYMLRDWMLQYITSGRVVAMILEGDDAVTKVRKITGFTDPSRAEKGTVRGDLGDDSIERGNSEKRPVYNLVHASGTPAEAEKEIVLWFGPDEIPK